jgi:hypothetical protein
MYLVADYGYSVMASDADRNASIGMAVLNMGIDIVRAHLETMRSHLPIIFKTHDIESKDVFETLDRMIRTDIKNLKMPVLPKIVEEEVAA